MCHPFNAPRGKGVSRLGKWRSWQRSSLIDPWGQLLKIFWPRRPMEAAEIWTFSCFFGIPETQPLFFQLNFLQSFVDHSPPFWLEDRGILALFSAWKQSFLHCAHDKSTIFLAHRSCRVTIFEVREHFWRLSTATHCSKQWQPPQLQDSQSDF